MLHEHEWQRSFRVGGNSMQAYIVLAALRGCKFLCFLSVKLFSQVRGGALIGAGRGAHRRGKWLAVLRPCPDVGKGRCQKTGVDVDVDKGCGVVNAFLLLSRAIK